MSRLRLLEIDSGRKWRGGQRQVLLLAQGLLRNGHRPFILAQPDSPLLRRAELAGLEAESFAVRSDWDLRAAASLRAIIRHSGADVVHAHDARSHAIARISLIGVRRPPLIVTRRITYPPKGVRLKYGNRVTRFIAVSAAVKRAMVAVGIEPERIVIVHSGVEAPPTNLVPRDWRKELGWPEDSVICGLVGAMTREKGVAGLAAIAAGLAPAARARARILLLGGERDGQVEIGGVPGFSAGFVEDITPAVAGIDVLWHPARSEALGTSLLDAMTLCVPPIAFAVGGITEVVEDEVSGLLVPPENIGAFSKAAERLIDDSVLRARLGEAAKTRAEMFTAADMAESTEAVYHDVLSGSRKHAAPSILR